MQTKNAKHTVTAKAALLRKGVSPNPRKWIVGESRLSNVPLRSTGPPTESFSIVIALPGSERTEIVCHRPLGEGGGKDWILSPLEDFNRLKDLFGNQSPLQILRAWEDDAKTRLLLKHGLLRNVGGSLYYPQRGQNLELLPRFTMGEVPDDIEPGIQSWCSSSEINILEFLNVNPEIVLVDRKVDQVRKEILKAFGQENPQRPDPDLNDLDMVTARDVLIDRLLGRSESYTVKLVRMMRSLLEDTTDPLEDLPTYPPKEVYSSAAGDFTSSLVHRPLRAPSPNAEDGSL